jgi:hypothetical protein
MCLSAGSSYPGTAAFICMLAHLHRMDRGPRKAGYPLWHRIRVPILVIALPCLRCTVCRSLCCMWPHQGVTDV